MVDEALELRDAKYTADNGLVEFICRRNHVILLSNLKNIILYPEDLFVLFRVIRPDCFFSIH